MSKFFKITEIGKQRRKGSALCRLYNVLFLFLFFAQHIVAQRLTTQVFTKDDGLIGNELTHVFIDSKDRIWLSSYASGISIFNGKTFKNFSKQKFHNYSPGRIVEDKQGRVSIFEFDHNGFGRIEGDSMKVFYVPHDGVGMWFNEKSQQIFAVNSKNTFFRFNEKTLQFEKIGDLPFSKESSFLGYDALTQKYEFIVNPFGLIQKWEWNTQTAQNIFTFKDNLRLNLLTEKWGNVFFTSDKKAFYVENGHKNYLKYPISELIPRYTTSDVQYHYLPTEPSSGLHIVSVFSKIDLSVVTQYTFQHPSQVTDVTMDKAGTLWCSTLYGLVRVFPQLMECKVGDPNMLGDLHNICEDKKGNIWFGTYGNGFCYFDGKQIQPSSPILKSIKNVLPGSITDDDGNMYFTTDESLTIQTDGFSYKKLWANNVGFYFTKNNTRGIAFGQANFNGLLIKEKNGQTQVIDSSKGLKLLNIITAVQDRQNRWWMGRGSQGFALYLPDRDTVLNWLRNAGSDFGAMASAIDDKGNLWFGTSRGLAFYSPPLSMPTDFNAFKDLIFVANEVLGNQSISFLKVYKNRYLAIGSQGKGLFLLDLEHFYRGNTKNPRIFSFPIKGSLVNSATEQNSVWIDRQGYLWSGHDQGAVRVDWDKWVLDTLPPKVWIQNVKSGQGVHFPKNNIVKLAPDENSLVIYLEKDLSPYFYDNVQFQYRLNNDSFRLIEGDKIELSYLNNQIHTLDIVAYKNGLAYPLPTLTLDVRPYFWKTVWFWAIIFGLTWFIYYRFARARRLILEKDRDLKVKDLALAENEKEKNMLQVQALVNQLNPHFINNALLWTQLRMMNDAESVKVISKLNYNISTVFRNSLNGKPFHSLKDEISIVANYLYIQNQRFEDVIDYELPNEEALSKWGNINVFLMQIQIHCENAVEHGIRNSFDGKGVLKITIFEEDAYLHMRIEDNGIGRKAAAKLRSKGTQQGTKMLENLQRIFNQNNDLPLTFEYQDDIFIDDQGYGYGTCVHIKVPKEYRYEFQ